jgi:putative glutamine amidotransferase
MRAGTLLHRLMGLVLGLAMGLSLSARNLERFLDAPRPQGDGARLVVFNPTVHNIRCLAALREKGLLEVPGLTIIGVFHDRQTENFEAAKTYTTEHGYGWLKFHAVTAELSEPVLFKRNACTPEYEAILAKADGVIFFGGSDIPASIFHQKTNLLSEVDDPYRNYLELSAIFHFLGGSQDRTSKPLLAARPGFPVLGICLGFQSLNVGTGGTLIQDIRTEIYHKASFEETVALGAEQWHNNPYKRLHPLDKLMSYNFHSLQLKGPSKLTKVLGFKAADHPRVLSSHHQALGKLGRGWITIATSRDGKVVEAIEHQQFPNVLGVQFHPEHYQLFDPEFRTRQKPGDTPTSYYEILAGTPPSLAFNKAIWTWFGARLQASHSH